MTPPLRFATPGYDQAIADFMGKVAQGILELDVLLRKMPTRRTVHAGPMRNVREPQVLDQPLRAFRYTLSIPFDVLRNTDIDQFTALLYDFAEAHRQELAGAFVQTMTAVAEATGNTISAEGQPLSFDMINDTLEMISISFDERGNPIMPTIVVHPDMTKKLMALEPTPEQLQRQAEILQRKKAAFDAQKRTRRLPRQHQ
jgi:hypothetical protein